MAKSKLLIAVSSPWASQRVAPAMVDLARRLDADTVVAHVAHAKADDEDESDARKRGEETLKIITGELTAAGITTDSVMLFSNDIAKALVNTAKARTCTMIVLGVAAKGVFKKLLHGDVPAHIVRQSDIPVLLCPAAWAGTM